MWPKCRTLGWAVFDPELTTGAKEASQFDISFCPLLLPLPSLPVLISHKYFRSQTLSGYPLSVNLSSDITIRKSLFKIPFPRN
jgi:hypothetical protein